VIVSPDLADLMRLLGHADRLRLIEELGPGERTVSELAAALALPSTRLSQHLALLRAHRLVAQRRDGRSHFDRLTHPQLAARILDALPFVDIHNRLGEAEHIERVRALWSTQPPHQNAE
jgi:DNA-binding transcriptional ArsR family regulator